MEAFDAAGVTGIVWRRVTPGNEAQAETVMQEIMVLARHFDGYLGSEIFPPIPGVQDAYVVLYRFNSGGNLRNWLSCTQRQKLLEKIAGLLVQPAVEFYFTHGRHQAGSASSVFAYRIRPEKEEEFQQWRHRILAEMRKWEGFLGTESFDAVEGSEPEFIIVLRFDSRPHLDAWLNSSVRKAYLDEVLTYVDRFTHRRIGSGFEGWFDISENTKPPARWRQAAVVLSALFPVIMVLRQVLHKVFEILPMPTAFLVLLTVDMVVLTYVVMPQYLRVINFWLKPTGNFSWPRELAGWAIILGIICVTLGLSLLYDSLG